MKKFLYVFLVILVGGLVSAATVKVNKKVILDGEKKIMTVRQSYVTADSAAVVALLPPGWTMEVKPR